MWEIDWLKKIFQCFAALRRWPKFRISSSVNEAKLWWHIFLPKQDHGGNIYTKLLMVEQKIINNGQFIRQVILRFEVRSEVKKHFSKQRPGAHLGFSEGRGPNFRKGANLHETKKKRI